jgi:hypothetical protein
MFICSALCRSHFILVSVLKMRLSHFLIGGVSGTAIERLLAQHREEDQDNLNCNALCESRLTADECGILPLIRCVTDRAGARVCSQLFWSPHPTNEDDLSGRLIRVFPHQRAVPDAVAATCEEANRYVARKRMRTSSETMSDSDSDLPALQRSRPDGGETFEFTGGEGKHTSTGEELFAWIQKFLVESTMVRDMDTFPFIHQAPKIRSVVSTAAIALQNIRPLTSDWMDVILIAEEVQNWMRSVKIMDSIEKFVPAGNALTPDLHGLIIDYIDLFADFRKKIGYLPPASVVATTFAPLEEFEEVPATSTSSTDEDYERTHSRNRRRHRSRGNPPNAPRLTPIPASQDVAVPPHFQLDPQARIASMLAGALRRSLAENALQYDEAETQLLILGKAFLASKNMESVCKNEAQWYIQVCRLRVSPDLTTLVSKIARRCYSLGMLDLSIRMHTLPSFFVPQHDYSRGDPPERWISNFSLAEAITVVQSMGANTLRAENGFQLRIRKSDAVGHGALKTLVAHAIEEAVLGNSGIFEASDDRRVFIRPVAGSRKLRVFGRLLGLAIKHKVPVRVPFTMGALWHLKDPLDAGKYLLPNETVMEWFHEENPFKAKRVSQTPLGYDFPDPKDKRVLTASNLGQFVQETALFDSIESIRQPMSYIVKGVYDVLPFPQLSWLSVEELRGMLGGGPENLRIDPEDVLRSLQFEGVGEASPAMTSTHEKWLREIIGSELEQEDLARFLRFTTGSPFLPIAGYGSLTIQVLLHDEPAGGHLPTGQVCYTQMTVKRYNKKRQLKAKLLRAIRECNSIDLY